MSTCPRADRPSRRNRDSADECCRSGPSSASGSRKTVTASSNETPCLAALASAFRGSHSNTHLVYTKCSRLWSFSAVPQPVIATCGSAHSPGQPCWLRLQMHTESYAVKSIGFCVRTVSHTPETLGQHRHLRGNAEADRCCGKSLIESALVGLSVRQHARGDSISKRAPSTTRTSLRLKSSTCGRPGTV